MIQYIKASKVIVSITDIWVQLFSHHTESDKAVTHFLLQHTAIGFDIQSIIYGTVWANEFIATMKLVKDNSCDIAQTKWHLLPYE